MSLMRITSKGQITIPQHIREQFGLMPETEVDFVIEGGNVVVRPAAAAPRDRAQRFVDGLRGSGHGRMTTDEIMQLTRDLDD